MKKLLAILGVLVFVVSISCKQNHQKVEQKTRMVVDTIGFAQYDWQMDSVMKQINISADSNHTWRVAISPHDDYAYVGSLYPKLLNGIKAKTVIFFGVAHKAKNYQLENKIVFDSFDAWSAPYGNVKVSEIRNEIISKLPDSLYVVNDEMHSIEHSLEALIPFLQYNQQNLEIVPILVPYMSFEKMQQITGPLSKFLAELMIEKNLKWGKDVSIVISTDAVHYGDQDWGGKNYAPFGTDSLGLIQARNHEMEIIQNCLLGEISIEKIQNFMDYTVQKSDYKEYKWTWCGRYSVPFGLLMAYQLENKIDGNKLNGTFIGYANSIDHQTLNVNDLKMGTTAPANNHHWVGYAAVGYE